LNEQIEVRRTAQGKLRIEGILDTDARKAELLAALAPLRDHPAVELRLQTVAEAARQVAPASPKRAATSIVEQTEVTRAALPVEPELRSYFTARGASGPQLEEELRRFSTATLARSLKIKSHATTLRQLSARFSTSELQSLDSQARTAWLDLLRGHARSLAAEAGQLRAALAPVFAGSGGDSAESVVAQNEEDLRRACARLAELGAKTDRAIRAAFTLSPDLSTALAIRGAAFGADLHRLQHLAEAVAQYP
jgi:hypothetical protein